MATATIFLQPPSLPHNGINIEAIRELDTSRLLATFIVPGVLPVLLKNSEDLIEIRKFLERNLKLKSNPSAVKITSCFAPCFGAHAYASLIPYVKDNLICICTRIQ